MPKIHVYENAKCLRCNSVKRKMILVGPMCFCAYCAHEEFSSDVLKNEIKSSDPRYKHWLKIYKEA
jgi:hypothetical protein